MQRTPLRQSEYETNLARAASRTQIIDAAVGRLQVQVDDLNARMDGLDEVMVAVNKLFTEMLDMLKSITENADAE